MANKQISELPAGSSSDSDLVPVQTAAGTTQTVTRAQLNASKADAVHSHTAANVSDFNEAVLDAVAAALVEGSNMTIDYDDNAGTITFAAAGGGSGGSVVVQEGDSTTVSAA